MHSNDVERLDQSLLAKPVFEPEIAEINERFRLLHRKIEGAERRLPFVFEFVGTPKAGKTSIRNMVARLAEKASLRVHAPLEPASLPSRRALRENLLAFNTWCGTYALESLLSSCVPANQFDIVVFDRGIIDAQFWLHVLAEREYAPKLHCAAVQAALGVSEWTKLIDAVFLIVCDPHTSIERERKDHLARMGNLATSEDFLEQLSLSYDKTELLHRFGLTKQPVFRIDSTHNKVDLRRAGFVVAQKIASVIEAGLNPQYWTVPSNVLDFVGFRSADDETLSRWDTVKKIVRKDNAETDASCKQLVAYAFVEIGDKYLRLRRTGPANRPELRELLSLGVGGHVEALDDENGSALPNMLKNAMQRELREELVFDQVPKLDLVGLINDESIDAGRFHVAIVFRARFRHGRVHVRPEVSDQEFGTRNWAVVDKERIFAESDSYDPWSQHVIEAVLGGPKAKISNQVLLPFQS